jgi:alanyl-tRNA synthetase
MPACTQPDRRFEEQTRQVLHPVGFNEVSVELCGGSVHVKISDEVGLFLLSSQQIASFLS